MANREQSAGSLASFFLACVKFGPQFIPRAQEELDRVVGKDRLPEFEDLPRLEFVRAIASETLRWRPVAVLGGTPHASTADNVYKGMFIPKGSTVIAPLWSSKLTSVHLALKQSDLSSPLERGRLPGATRVPPRTIHGRASVSRPLGPQRLRLGTSCMPWHACRHHLRVIEHCPRSLGFQCRSSKRREGSRDRR